MEAGRHDRSKGDHESETVALLPSGYVSCATGISDELPAESLITSANVFSASATAPPPMPSCVWDEAFDVSQDGGDPDDERNDDANGEQAVTGGSSSSIRSRKAAHRGNLFLEADPDPRPTLSRKSGRGRAGTDAPRGRGLVAPVDDASWSATAAAHRPDAAKFTRPPESTIRRLIAVRPHPRLLAAALLGPLLLALAWLGVTLLGDALGGTRTKHREAFTAAAAGRHQPQSFAPNRWVGEVAGAVASPGYRIASRPRPRQAAPRPRRPARRPRSSLVSVAAVSSPAATPSAPSQNAYTPTQSAPAAEPDTSYTSPAAPRAPPPSYSPSPRYSPPSTSSPNGSTASSQQAGPTGPVSLIGAGTSPSS